MTNASSSATSAPWRPSSSSASKRSSWPRPELLEARDSACANGSNARSASAGPRQSASASRSLAALCVRRRLRLAREPLEPVRVDEVAIDREHVARRALVTSTLGPECLAQLGDEVLERADRGLRRCFAPQVLDEPVGRDDLAGVKSEQREQCPLLGTTQLERRPPKRRPRAGPSSRTSTAGICRLYTVAALEYRARMSRA